MVEFDDFANMKNEVTTGSSKSPASNEKSTKRRASKSEDEAKAKRP